jgi:hypothetical protein
MVIPAATMMKQMNISAVGEIPEECSTAAAYRTGSAHRRDYRTLS